MIVLLTRKTKYIEVTRDRLSFRPHCNLNVLTVLNEYFCALYFNIIPQLIIDLTGAIRNFTHSQVEQCAHSLQLGTPKLEPSYASYSICMLQLKLSALQLIKVETNENLCTFFRKPFWQPLCPWRKKSRSNHRKGTLYSITRINYNSQLLYNSSLFSKTQFSSGGGFGAPKADLLTQKASKTRSLSTMFYHLCQAWLQGPPTQTMFRNVKRQNVNLLLKQYILFPENFKQLI